MRLITPRSRWVLPLVAISTLSSSNALTATESNTTLTLANDRIRFVLDKATARISTVDLDGLNLLGTPVSSSSAIGPYVDSYAVTPKGGNYVPGKTATYKLITGTDSAGILYGGMVMSQAEPDGVVGEWGDMSANLTAQARCLNNTGSFEATRPACMPLRTLRTTTRRCHSSLVCSSSAPSSARTDHSLHT